MTHHILVLLSIFLWLMPVNAQDTTQPTFDNHTWDVFIERNTGENNMDTLVFIDVLTGETVSVETHGERYTPVLRGVIFFDWIENQVKLATPEGVIQNHPFIIFSFGIQRIDWVISHDRKSIAWTLTREIDTNALITTTQLADIDGSNIREMLIDGPYDSVRALPIAFSEDNSELYIDAHPDGLSQFSPYTQYAGLFSLDLTSGDITPLPGEPSCFCGAGFGSGMLVRLLLNNNLDGFDVKVYSVDGGEPRTISAITRRNYTQAGDVLLSDDGSFAIYALSQVRGFGTAEQIVRTVFIQVDLLTLEQEIINNPITTFVHPVAWTEDNTAILFTSEQQNGTWKINLEDGQLVKVANASYIGRLHNLE
jgi:hypothetical protein